MSSYHNGRRSVLVHPSNEDIRSDDIAAESEGDGNPTGTVDFDLNEEIKLGF